MKTDFVEHDGGYSAGMNCNVAAAMIGAAVVGGVASSSAAKSAANGQRDAANTASQATLQATRETNDMQWRMYQQNLANSSPYMKAGQTAQAALMGGMGLGNPYTGSTSGSTGGALSSVGQAVQNSGAPSYVNAVGQMVDAAGNVLSNADSGTTNYGADNATLTNAYNQYAGADGKGQFTETFKPSDLTTDPSYQWRLNQGMQALKASQAATGTLQTGQGLKDINDYAQGAASQEYGNAYNRFMNNQSTLYNRLAGIAGTGQTTTSQVNAAGQATAGNIASNTMSGVNASNGLLTSGAAAAAAGKVGSANAWGSALNSGVNGWMTLQYMNGGNNAGAGASTAGAPVGGYNNSAGDGMDFTG